MNSKQQVFFRTVEERRRRDVFNVTRILRQVRKKGEPSLSKNVVQRSIWFLGVSDHMVRDRVTPVVLNLMRYY